MLDCYWNGATTRISPEAPVPVVRIMEQEARVGGAGNVALNTAALGAKTFLLGFLGEDRAGDQIAGLVEKAGVTGRLHRIEGMKTIQKLRVLSRHQQLIRLDFDDGFHGLSDDALVSEFRLLINEVDIVILSDYAKGALRLAPDFIRIAQNAGKRVVVDPKGKNFDIYRGASLMTPNESEFEAIVGPCSDQTEFERRAHDLLNSLDLGGLLITRSEKGMSLFERGRSPLHLPTHAREVFDVTGAGDTVAAILGVAWGAGFTLEDAVRLSNLGAGLVVAKLGTATISQDELSGAVSMERPSI